MLGKPDDKDKSTTEERPVRSSILISALTAAAFALPSTAAAQDYPTRTVKALTTTSAGGISDIFMRALGDELHKRWGQPIIVENRPGGMQNLGARACTEAPPDGYTICILNAEPVAYNQFLLKSMPFDPEKGLQPITNLYHLIQTLVVNASLKVKTIDELIALSKAKPGTLNYVTASVPLAFYMETLVKEKGADWVRVPFKGGGEAVNAVLGGSTPIALIGEGNVIGQIRAGTMTALVMLNNIRSPNFPDVPTLEETGYKGVPSRSWYGLFAPAGTPKPIVDKIAKDVASIVSDSAFRERHLTARSLVPATNTPEQFAEEIKRDRAAAERVVKEAGLTPQ
jgi:tripartite-type tricarboxylate transporter receptor subunit TctC